MKNHRNINSPKSQKHVILSNYINDNKDCTQKVIYDIDSLIEKKSIPNSVKNNLESLRNYCAIHMMNLTQLEEENNASD